MMLKFHRMTWFAFTGCVAMLAMASTAARAVEDVTPYLPGSSIGVPAGLLPPPGVYGSLSAAHFDFAGKNSAENSTAAKIRSTPFSFGLLWVPDVKIFGASYGVGFIQPFRDQILTTPVLKSEVLGPVNTILNLSTLSWNLGSGFFVSAGMNFYVNDGDYIFGRPVNTGRNYMTFEPRAAISYIANGWKLTSNLLFDVNTENTTTHYQSGRAVILDLSAIHRFGKFEIGVGSDIIEQYTDDTKNGVVVAAVPNGAGRGNRAHYISVGPIVGYDFGPFAVQVFYQQNVSASNTGAGNQIWSRINFPLYANNPVGQTQLDSAGRR